MASAAVRCGLIVDLALAGVMRPSDEGIELASRATGFPPADKLIVAMEAQPGRTLDSWFDDTEVGLKDVIESLVSDGRWRHRKTFLGSVRYLPCDRRKLEADLRRDVSMISADWEASDACVAAFGSIANLVGDLRQRSLRVLVPDIPDYFWRIVEDDEWVIDSAIESLRRTRARHAFGAKVLG